MKKEKRKGKKGKGKKKEKEKRERIEKTIKVNLYPGKRKRKILRRAERENTEMANEMLKFRVRKDTYRKFGGV